MTEPVHTRAPAREWSASKHAFFACAERVATERELWIRRNRAYYEDDYRYMRFIIRKGARVLDLGCSTGSLLAALEPSHGIGVDFSPRMIEVARNTHRHLEFVLGDAENASVIEGLRGPFDYIIISDTIGMFEDIEKTLEQLQDLCTPDTRLVIAYYSPLWEPLLRLATATGRRMPQPRQSLLSRADFFNILELADFEPIRMEWRYLLPFKLIGLGRLINRFLAPLPGVRRLCLRNYVIARSKRARPKAPLSTSIVIPCRNEKGNIEHAVRQMPRFGGFQEIIFVEGHSEDATYDECLRVQRAYAGQWNIRVLRQEGRGKGDAVRLGLAEARGDVLMILDADLTMAPTTLPKFYTAIVTGKGELINGTRLVYPMEKEAMRFLNQLANRGFASMFSYLLNQRFTDTLCGTKALRRQHYTSITASRSYFGDFDPFGDFDLLFGAAKHSLRIIEVPIHYKARIYGSTQISRFRDGWLLLRMTLFAYLKLKAI